MSPAKATGKAEAATVLVDPTGMFDAYANPDAPNVEPSSLVPIEPAPMAELAPVDLLIERADLGEGCSTLVTAGSPIPAHLAGLPRTPA